MISPVGMERIHLYPSEIISITALSPGQNLPTFSYRTEGASRSEETTNGISISPRSRRHSRITGLTQTDLTVIIPQDNFLQIIDGAPAIIGGCPFPLGNIKNARQCPDWFSLLSNIPVILITAHITCSIEQEIFIIRDRKVSRGSILFTPWKLIICPTLWSRRTDFFHLCISLHQLLQR